MADGGKMADYVLVHGGNVSTDTWNRITKGPQIHTADGRLGGAVWDSVTPALREHNHRCFTPTLGDEHICGLSGHIDQICTLITDNNLNNIILAAHSYGGMIITGVASKMPERIGRLVYLDADWPDPGQSLFDVLKASGLDPQAAIPGLETAKAYVEKISYDPGKAKSLKKFFIRCTAGGMAVFVNVAIRKIETSGEDWTIWELPTTHLAQATMPEELGELLLKAAE